MRRILKGSAFVRRVSASASLRSVGFLSLLAVLLGASAACGDTAAGADAGFAVRDSAGVTIVENAAPVWAEGAGWRLSPDPAVEIGMTEGPEVYLLSRVSDVRRAADGSVVIANRGSGEVRYYDPAGRHIRTVGGRGEGPGEFVSLGWLHLLAGDTVVAHDPQLRRLSVFGPDGDFVRSIALASSREGRDRLALGLFSDGTVLARGTRYGPRAGASDTEVVRHTAAFLRLAPTGELLDTLRLVPERQEVWTEAPPVVMSMDVLFGPGPVAAVRQDRAFIGSSEAFEIAVHSSTGAVERLIRRIGPPRPLPAEVHERVRSGLVESEEDPAARNALRRIMEGMPIPESFPAFSQFVPDDVGNLWVNETAELEEGPPSWSVFDPEGRLLGTVVTPEDFAPKHIGDDFVLGVWKDEVDVERVRLYDLEK